MRKLQPLHPGVMVRENIEAMDLKIIEAANIMKISKQHLHRVIKGTNPVSPEVAYRLGVLFGNGARFWLALQAQYDAHAIEDEYNTCEEKKEIVRTITKELEEMMAY